MRVNKIFDQIGFERQTVGFEWKIEWKFSYFFLLLILILK
jgi:hypothetical protein